MAGIVDSVNPAVVDSTIHNASNGPQALSVNEAEENSEDRNEKLLKLPLSRIKTIMKTDPDFRMAGSEAAFLIAKAAELFIANISGEAYQRTKVGNRKTIQKKDVEEAIDAVDEFAFLEGALDT